MLKLCLTPTIVVAALALPMTAATFCVNPNGQNGCTKTIAAAVTAASANDVINVAPGTYAESVTIGKPLTLLGIDPAKTIIDATGLPIGIYIDGIDNSSLTGVTVSGFTVENAKYEGILITNASAVTVTGNVLTGNNKGLTFTPGASPTCPGIAAFELEEGFDCGEAIHLSGVNHSSILNNTVTNNAGGILLSDDTGATHDNLIVGNNVSNNPFDCGITLASHAPAPLTGSATPLGVYANAIIGNTANQNGLMGEGSGVGLFASGPGGKTYGNVVLNNTMNGNGLPGVALHGHTPNQVLDGNQIIGNHLSGNGADTDDAATPGTAGIALTSVVPVSGTVIAQNVIDHETIAVAWHAPGAVSVQGNSFSATYGIYNLGSGTVSADANWWGCAANPTSGLAGFAGCATTSGGGITVNTWMLTNPAPKQ